jgi:hypothetical protein
MSDKPFVTGECDIDARQTTLSFTCKRDMKNAIKNETENNAMLQYDNAALSLHLPACVCAAYLPGWVPAAYTA